VQRCSDLIKSGSFFDAVGFTIELKTHAENTDHAWVRDVGGEAAVFGVGSVLVIDKSLYILIYLVLTRE